METAYETNHCFGCGRDNPIGLKLDMKLDGDRCVAYFTPKAEHESYGDRMHGGLTSTLLDEVMGDYVFRKAGETGIYGHGWKSVSAVLSASGKRSKSKAGRKSIAAACSS